jgi:hypothetical protein
VAAQTRRIGQMNARFSERLEGAGEFACELMDDVLEQEEVAEAMEVTLGACGTGSVYDLNYELATIQQLMTAATPAAVVKIQQIDLVQLSDRGSLKLPPGSQAGLVMGEDEMRKLRPDAESWGVLEAGIAIGRCQRILCVFIDETEIEKVSVLSIIVLIIDEYGDLRMLTLIGLVVLASKTAVAQVDAINESFEETRECVQEAMAMYDECRKTRRLCQRKGHAQEHMVDDQVWTKEDWDTQLHNFGDALEEFCDPHEINATRIEAASSDHCAAAQAALQQFFDSARGEDALELYYKDWATASEDEREIRRERTVFGCMHHLRCCGWAAMERALEEMKKPWLAEDVKAIRSAGVVCVTGEQAMQWRSILLYFGSTIRIDYRSRGEEFKGWYMEQDGSFDEERGVLRHDYRGRAWRDIPCPTLHTRQDGLGAVCFDSINRVGPMKAFCGDYNQREEDINFLPAILISLESDVLQCEAAAYALIFSCVSEIHRLMSSKGAEIGDDGALAAADTIDEDGTTYIVVKKEYQGHVRASRIRRLGPAELHEIVAQEVFPFLKRVAENPAILGDRMGWRQCYKSTVTQQYGLLNEAMHGVGSKRGGEDINRYKTTLSFCQESVRRELEAEGAQHCWPREVCGDGEGASS